MPPDRPLAQKTIGVLGGMSNQATAEYYRLLNERLNAAAGFRAVAGMTPRQG